MEMSGQLHDPAALPAEEKPLVPIGGSQNRSGRDGEVKIPSPSRESNPRTPIVQPVVQRYTD
jgi:hypothetical protein